jgi:hypothetical protein
MSKLIRVDSVRNDGRFLPNYTTDIKLNGNASIALKDICFEPEFEVININDGNNTITVKNVSADNNNNLTTQKVETGIYNYKDQYRVVQEVMNSLNRSLASTTTDLADNQYNQFSTYRIRSQGENGDPDTPLDILYRLCPVASIKNDFISYLVEGDGFDNDVIQLTDIGDRQILQQNSSSVNDERYRVVAKKGISLPKGSGVFYAQIYDSVAQGGGLVEFNGFVLGVTLEKKQDLPSDENTTNPRVISGENKFDIPATARNFEIDFREQGQVYRFRSGGLGSSPTLQNSTVNPYLTGVATIDTNDIVMIRVNTFNKNKVIEGVVLQMTGNGGTEGEEEVLFRYDLTNEDIGNEFGAENDPDDLEEIMFTPYIVMRGASANCRLANVRFTPDTSIDYRILGENLFVKDTSYFPVFNDHVIQDEDLVDSGFQNVIPQVKENQFSEFFDQQFTSTVNLSDEIGSALGQGPRNKNNQDKVYRFVNQEIRRYDKRAPIHLVLPNFDPRLYGIFGALFPFQNNLPNSGDDYYLVELNNLNLDSYSSIPNETLARTNNDSRTNQGERKNIVATIPVKDQSFGRRITYEPNEIHFISIKNSETVNLRNLQIRVLHPNYDPVNTYGRSHVCLYVKD